MTGPAAFDAHAADAEARALFDRLWTDDDPWALEHASLDQRRYARQLAMIDDRRYERALEIGCGAGSFTSQLSPRCRSIVAIDIAEEAVRRARSRLGGREVDVRCTNVMEGDVVEEGGWDLVVIAETIYYLGWLYPLFHVGWLLRSLHDAAVAGARLLLVDTIHGDTGIMSPWLISTYRDLAVNCGWAPLRHEVLDGVKDETQLRVRLDLFERT